MEYSIIGRTGRTLVLEVCFTILCTPNFESRLFSHFSLSPNLMSQDSVNGEQKGSFDVLTFPPTEAQGKGTGCLFSKNLRLSM